MTLDIKEIKNVIESEENTGGFAELVKKLKKIGVTKYEYFVESGMYRYYDKEGSVDLQLNGVPKIVTGDGDSQKIRDAVKTAQSGSIDFENFCELAGLSGVTHWTSDLMNNKVNYCSHSGEILLSEPILV